jgi:hypothetical protein
LKSSTTAILLFEAAPGAYVDHVDFWEWFEPQHVDGGTVYEAVISEIVVDRHAGDAANYLDADGHIKSIGAVQVQQWCAEGSEETTLPVPAESPFTRQSTQMSGVSVDECDQTVMT